MADADAKARRGFENCSDAPPDGENKSPRRPTTLPGLPTSLSEPVVDFVLTRGARTSAA